MNSYWLENQLPGVNCVVKNNGDIVILNCFKNEEGRPFCFPFCDSTISSLLKHDEDIWTEIQTFDRLQDKTNKINLSVGEGGMGNEGFIVCTDDQQSFIWGIFFENSNPFTKVEVRENKITAYSTGGYKYEIELGCPEKIEITPF